MCLSGLVVGFLEYKFGRPGSFPEGADRKFGFQF